MVKKVITIIILLLIFLFVVFVTPTYAVTEKQKEVGKLIAIFARYVSTHNESDFGYSFTIGKDKNGNVVTMSTAIGHRETANKAGIQYTGSVYFETPRSSIIYYS